MGRYLLGGKEARFPYEVEELDLRLYTVEELCYFIYHNLALIGDDFIDEHLLEFISDELGLPEIRAKIERFYRSSSDQDATLHMMLSDIGYYNDKELMEFQNRLVSRRRKNGPERIRDKADFLFEAGRYMKAIRVYRVLLYDRDGRITPEMRSRVAESIANCCGRLYAYDEAMRVLYALYRETKKERLLKKIYEVSMVSGVDPPENCFENVPDNELLKWQKEYWVRENTLKSGLEENPLMQAFFKDKNARKSELSAYTDQEKDRYRAMCE